MSAVPVLCLASRAAMAPTRVNAMKSLAEERDVIADELGRTGGRFGPVSGFVIPTLKAIGLFSERISGHFEEMWSANINAETARKMVENLGELPDDLEAWVNEGYEAL